MNIESQELLDTKSAAKLLHCSKEWLQQGRIKGHGPKYVKIGVKVVYRMEDLREFINSHTVDPSTAKEKKNGTETA